MVASNPIIEVVGEAANGREATKRVRCLRPDVVVMDVSMPKMNGIDATLIIKQEFPGVRLFGLSMFEEDIIAQQIQAAGVDALVYTGDNYNHGQYDGLAPNQTVHLIFLTNRFDKFTFVHLASAIDVQLSGPVVEFLFGSVLEVAVGVAGPLGGLVGRFALFAPLFVDCTGGNFLGPLGAFSYFLGAFFDVFVLTFFFIAPCIRHHDASVNWVVDFFLSCCVENLPNSFTMRVDQQ